MSVTLETPLIELPTDEISRQWAEQFDRWQVADSEAKQSCAIADEERQKLDEIGAEFRRRIGGGAVQPLLVDAEVSP